MWDSHFNKTEIHVVMKHHTTIKHVTLEYSYIFKQKNPGYNIILIARKSNKMFQNMKMYITENKANLKFTSEKCFSRKMLIFPDFPDIQPKFPDFSVKKTPFSNCLIIHWIHLFPGWLWTQHRKKSNSVVVSSCRPFLKILKYKDHHWNLPTIWKTSLLQKIIQEF